MKNIINLRQEIAQMRLTDLTQEYGKQSRRVATFKQRMGDLINEKRSDCLLVSSQVNRNKKLSY